MYSDAVETRELLYKVMTKGLGYSHNQTTIYMMRRTGCTQERTDAKK